MAQQDKLLFTEIPHLEGERIYLDRITDKDASGLEELRNDEDVYRLLPTFLFEKQLEDIHQVIREMYDGPIYKNEESLHLGIFLKATDEFVGIIELYGYRKEYKKISVGYRLCKRFWGQGIASEAAKTLMKYLLEETDIEIITASTMVENKASAKVLAKCGFVLVVDAVGEDWGYPSPTLADKWIL